MQKRIVNLRLEKRLGKKNLFALFFIQTTLIFFSLLLMLTFTLDWVKKSFHTFPAPSPSIFIWSKTLNSLKSFQASLHINCYSMSLEAGEKTDFQTKKSFMSIDWQLMLRNCLFNLFHHFLMIWTSQQILSPKVVFVSHLTSLNNSVIKWMSATTKDAIQVCLFEDFFDIKWFLLELISH